MKYASEVLRRKSKHDGAYFQSLCWGLLLPSSGLRSLAVSALVFKQLPLTFILIFYSTAEVSQFCLSLCQTALHRHAMTEDWQPLSVRGLPSGGGPANLSLCLIDSHNPGSWLTTTYTHKWLPAWVCISLCLCITSCVTVHVCLRFALWIHPEALLLGNQQISNYTVTTVIRHRHGCADAQITLTTHSDT